MENMYNRSIKGPYRNGLLQYECSDITCCDTCFGCEKCEEPCITYGLPIPPIREMLKIIYEHSTGNDIHGVINMAMEKLKDAKLFDCRFPICYIHSKMLCASYKDAIERMRAANTIVERKIRWINGKKIFLLG